MDIAHIPRLAEESYRNGSILLHQGRYGEAIIELTHAESLFRRYDSEGHARDHALENGISGLASTLYLLGSAHRLNDNIPEAIRCLETSLINERFEKFIPFRPFREMVRADLASCYELRIAGKQPPTLAILREENPTLDLACIFPFSLDPVYISFARLYELAPDRHPRLREFYEQAKQYDAAVRRGVEKTDDASMRKISIGIWSIIAAVWIAYGIIVARALMHK